MANFLFKNLQKNHEKLKNNSNVSVSFFKNFFIKKFKLGKKKKNKKKKSLCEGCTES
jgi:hypothetical protein